MSSSIQYRNGKLLTPSSGAKAAALSQISTGLPFRNGYLPASQPTAGTARSTASSTLPHRDQSLWQPSQGTAQAALAQCVRLKKPVVQSNTDSNGSLTIDKAVRPTQTLMEAEPTLPYGQDLLRLLNAGQYFNENINTSHLMQQIEIKYKIERTTLLKRRDAAFKQIFKKDAPAEIAADKAQRKAAEKKASLVKRTGLKATKAKAGVEKRASRVVDPVEDLTEDAMEDIAEDDMEDIEGDPMEDITRDFPEDFADHVSPIATPSASPELQLDSPRSEPTSENIYGNPVDSEFDELMQFHHTMYMANYSDQDLQQIPADDVWRYSQ